MAKWQDPVGNTTVRPAEVEALRRRVKELEVEVERLRQIADKLEKRLLVWQQSVLESLMGEDYK
jgi:cell division septum initiation protein DivIVA